MPEHNVSYFSLSAYCRFSRNVKSAGFSPCLASTKRRIRFRDFPLFSKQCCILDPRYMISPLSLLNLSYVLIKDSQQSPTPCSSSTKSLSSTTSASMISDPTLSFDDNSEASSFLVNSESPSDESSFFLENLVHIIFANITHGISQSKNILTSSSHKPSDTRI